MSCKITYNESGNIVKVLDSNGKESKLFNDIAKLPHVESLEQAVQIYEETLKANPNSDDGQTGFYSNAIRAINNLKDKAVKNVKGWVNQLTDFQKTGEKNVAQELEWIGLQDYLESWVEENQPKNGNIPFKVVEQYLKDNQIEIVEVSKGDRNYKDLLPDGWTVSEFINGANVYDENGKHKGEGSNIGNAIADAGFRYEDTGSNEKYSGYQLEGGENYREVLLTLPSKQKRNPLHDERERLSKLYSELKQQDRHDEAFEIDNQIGEITKELKKTNSINEEGIANQYKSNHWDESNILAHVRMNERTLPNGERVLFIEEVQSDWAQDGKKRGYVEGYKREQLSPADTSNDTQDRIDRFYLIDYVDENGVAEQTFQLLKSKHASYEAAVDYIVNKKVKDAEAIPNMPYKKTDQWVGMAMRRVMQMATQEGFDRIAWVTGEQSADRYDLSKKVGSIIHKQNKDGTYDLTVLDNSGNRSASHILVNEVDITIDKVEEYVGKELASKIEKREGSVVGDFDNVKELSGTDLEVGGEGMKTFYNSILPKVAKKEAQRFDKAAKVDVVSFKGNNKLIKYTSLGWSVRKNNEGSWEILNPENEIVETEFNQLDAELTATDLANDTRIAQESDLKSDIGKQLSVAITDTMKNKLAGAVPMFSLESKDKKYADYKEALDDTSIKSVNIVSNGIVVASFPTSVDARTLEGTINSLIADGIVAPNKIIFNGNTYFQTTGETVSDRIISEEVLKEVISETLDKDQYTIVDGLVQMHPKKIGVSPEGTMHRAISDKLLNYFSADTVISKKEKINENNLKLNLMKILSDMGVSVLTLKEYQDRFKMKSNDIPPSAEALADIVNRVIAFKDGKLTIDNLTEEVMHFIVETLPQDELEGLSELIRDSQEYKDFSEQYRDVYKNDQNLIDKEILGKILKNITLNKTTGKSETFIGKIFDIVRNFFNNLTSTQSQKDQLAKLNILVDKFVIQQDGNNFNESSLEQSKQIALMYSLSQQVSNTQGALEKIFKNITDFKQFNSYRRELKSVNFENLKGRELASAVGRFIEMSTKLIETTDAAIKTSKDNGKALSGQNKAILEDLSNEIASNLDSLAEELSTPTAGISRKESSKLAEKLSENSTLIAKLRAANDKTADEHVREMTEELLVQMGEAESEFFRAQVEKALRGEIEDTNRIFSFFGQLHHASNPILNMIGSKIWEMNMKANQGKKEDISDFLNYMQDNKISNKEFSTLVENGYLKDVVDHKGFEDALLTAEMEAFSNISGQNFTDLAVYKTTKQAGELDELTPDNYGKYVTLLQEKQIPLTETIMNEQYYKELFDKYEKLNISGATQAFLKQNSADRGAIKANATKTYLDEDGKKVTRVVLSPKDNDYLNSISKIRKARKNIYTEISTRKAGLEVTTKKPTGDSVKLPTGQYLSLNITKDMSQGEIDFANISFDLHNLDNAYMEKVQAESGTSEGATEIAKNNFIGYIQAMQANHSEKDIYNTIMSNLDVSLSQKFYDTLNGDSFLKDDSLEKLNPGKEKIIKNVKSLYAKRNAILSMYRNTSSPFEIDKMTTSDQGSIRSLSIKISDSLNELKLPEGTEEGDSAGEKAPNKAYKATIKDKVGEEGTQEELDFLIESEHSNTARINKLTDAYKKNEKGMPLSKSDQRMIDKYEGANLLETQLKYAKSHLQPYYTRFAPIGYESIEERINKGEEIIDILIDILSPDGFLNVRIDNSFEENNNPLKNPNYKDDYDGGFRQPKKGTYVNNEFKNRFGINAQGQATKETVLFEARRLYLEARKKGLEKMEEKGYNPYREIQISRTKTEKVSEIIGGKQKKQTAKDLLKDTFAYRIDDLAYGEAGFESNRQLPKYYTRDLEDQNDVTSDYMFALTQFVSRANEYKAKRNVISDIDALYDILLRTRRHSKSKTLEQAIKMANSYIDSGIYGKIENRTMELKVPGTDYSMDVAKLSRVFTKYVSLKNLGFNTTVPLTGLISGLVSKRVEEWIGEKLNRDSSRLASAEYKNLMKDGRSQALDFNDNSKLFLIGQAFGIYDISEKARNAKYNTFKRTFSKTAMGLHTMANYPIIPKIALSVMYDNRFIDGKITNRTQYFQEQTRGGVSKAEMETTWKAAEDDAIYNHMNFSKTGFTWADSVKKYNLNEEYLEDRKLFMMRNIRLQVSNIDATIPQEMRLAAQRDAVGSMMLLHKGFLSIFLQNRLKKRNLNLDTGLLEEGSYRTLTGLMADFFNTKGNMGAKIDNLKASLKPPLEGASNEDWLDYELRLRNMNRIAKEMAAMGILVTLGALVFAMASDPDNEDRYEIQMTSYLTTRLLNESATAFTPSILTDLTSTIESPIVTYDTAKSMVQVWKVFDGDEIRQGKYKGLSVRQRWATKNALGVKGVYDIYGADNIRESEKTYRLYNEENINMSTLGMNSLLKSLYIDK